MKSSRDGLGSEFLARKSDVTRLRQALPVLDDVLIVEDEIPDADRLQATLRVMFGYDLQVRCAQTLGKALDCIIARKPALVLLDDVLKPSDTALQAIPFLRHADYTGPIVVVSGQVTRNHRVKLLAAGATDVIHKDDVDSVRLGEALLRVFSAEPNGQPGDAGTKSQSTESAESGT